MDSITLHSIYGSADIMEIRGEFALKNVNQRERRKLEWHSGYVNGYCGESRTDFCALQISFGTVQIFIGSYHFAQYLA